MHSAAAIHPSALSAKVVFRALSGTDFSILCNLASLVEMAQRRNPTKEGYAFCGQAWLAQQCGRSRSWVSERTSYLMSLGLLRKIYRRHANGCYQTCLYRLPHSIWKKMRVKFSHLFKGPNRVESNRHKRTSLCTSALRSADSKPVRVTELTQRIEALAARERERQRKPPGSG